MESIISFFQHIWLFLETYLHFMFWFALAFFLIVGMVRGVRYLAHR